jgi:hypothetical protein
VTSRREREEALIEDADKAKDKDIRRIAVLAHDAIVKRSTVLGHPDEASIRFYAGISPGITLGIIARMRTAEKSLEAAHRREDAIRKLPRFEKGLDGYMEAAECGEYFRCDEVYAILDGDKAAL